MTSSSRLLALDALDRIDRDGAYANLLVPDLLDRSDLEARDRHFVTELVYGTTRMRRACDFLVDRFLTRELDLRVRNALRLGAYQLHFLGMPPHAAVGETVEVAPKPARGLVNAVLRRVSGAPVTWPDDATRLSYPDWIVGHLVADLGSEDAIGALEVMNTAPAVTERADGYVQDLASQWVADAVGATPGDRVADLCAAPGGKATALAAAGATVIAADIRKARVGLIRANAPELPVLAADAARPPFPPGSFDHVLLDAPCSGLGTLRRRPDARWRIDAASPERLAAVQRSLVDAAVPLLRPGGTLVYSVCTLTEAETTGIDDHLASTSPQLLSLAPPDGPWNPHGRGSRLLPQAADTDGMYLLRACAPPPERRQTAWMALLAKVITVSDGVVAGTREDASGQALEQHLAQAGYDVVERIVTADGADAVATTLTGACDGFAGLVVTTGGTGFGPRDLTPEGTLSVLERQAPGIAEAMRLVSPLGRLSRAVAGTLGACLILNTPGSTKGCIETLDAVLDVAPHALELLAGQRPH